MNPKTTWHVFQTYGDELESLLNKLSDNDHKIFSVQFTDKQWVVITEKVLNEEQDKVQMGFGAKRL